MIPAERTKTRARFRKFINIHYKLCTLDSGLYSNYLRKRGVKIGAGTVFSGKPLIDLTRPCLVEIGKNCVITDGVAILTHGYDFSVLMRVYGEMLGSSGKVKIDDNVFLGIRSIILKGVHIGKNSIIGAGSVVTHDIPANSVAAGNPCKVIMTLDQYFEKRKNLYVQEAKAYARELYRSTGRIPKREDFLDEFPIFLDRSIKLDLLEEGQIGPSIKWYLNSKPVYPSLESFLIDSGIPLTTISSKKQ